MASKWFYSQDGVRRGPVSSAELRQLAREGVLKPQDLLWKEGMAEWLPASKTQKLFPTDELSYKSSVSQSDSTEDSAALPNDSAAASRSSDSPSLQANVRVLVGDAVQGPMTRVQVASLHAKSGISPGDLVSISGGPWIRVSDYLNDSPSDHSSVTPASPQTPRVESQDARNTASRRSPEQDLLVWAYRIAVAIALVGVIGPWCTLRSSISGPIDSGFSGSLTILGTSTTWGRIAILCLLAGGAMSWATKAWKPSLTVAAAALVTCLIAGIQLSATPLAGMSVEYDSPLGESVASTQARLAWGFWFCVIGSAGACAISFIAERLQKVGRNLGSLLPGSYWRREQAPSHEKYPVANVNAGKASSFLKGSLAGSLMVLLAMFAARPDLIRLPIGGDGELMLPWKRADRRDEKPIRSGSRKSKDERSAVQITASQLFTEYSENDVGADKRYKDKLLQVSGNVGAISRDFREHIYVTLDAGEAMIFSIQCFFADSEEDKAAELRPGQFLTIRGRCGGKFGNVFLRDCSIVPLGSVGDASPKLENVPPRDQVKGLVDHDARQGLIERPRTGELDESIALSSPPAAVSECLDRGQEVWFLQGLKSPGGVGVLAVYLAFEDQRLAHVVELDSHENGYKWLSISTGNQTVGSVHRNWQGLRDGDELRVSRRYQQNQEISGGVVSIDEDMQVEATVDRDGIECTWIANYEYEVGQSGERSSSIGGQKRDKDRRRGSGRLLPPQLSAD